MSKYKSIKCQIGNIFFDSKREMRHYAELKLRERAKEIRDLKLQPEFVLLEGFRDRNGKKIRPIVYRADFSYVDCKTGIMWTEDVKGFETAVFKIKEKLLLARFPEINFRKV